MHGRLGELGKRGQPIVDISDMRIGVSIPRLFDGISRTRIEVVLGDDCGTRPQMYHSL